MTAAAAELSAGSSFAAFFCIAGLAAGLLGAAGLAAAVPALSLAAFTLVVWITSAALLVFAAAAPLATLLFAVALLVGATARWLVTAGATLCATAGALATAVAVPAAAPAPATALLTTPAMTVDATGCTDATSSDAVGMRASVAPVTGATAAGAAVDAVLT
jgi:hypothetical protein